MSKDFDEIKSLCDALVYGFSETLVYSVAVGEGHEERERVLKQDPLVRQLEFAITMPTRTVTDTNTGGSSGSSEAASLLGMRSVETIDEIKRELRRLVAKARWVVGYDGPEDRPSFFTQSACPDCGAALCAAAGYIVTCANRECGRRWTREQWISLLT